MELTKNSIMQLLETKNKHVIGRALVALNDRQTATEQRVKDTINRNGKGFRPAQAYMGTSMAQFYASRNHLTENQIRYWTVPSQKVKGNQRDADGRPLKQSRISLYAGQLLKVAQIKKGLKDCPHNYDLNDGCVYSPEQRQTLETIQMWCKEMSIKFFVNPEHPDDGIYFANEDDKVLCGLKWS